MNDPELTVSITTKRGCPFIAIRGSVTAWHGRSVEDIIVECALDDVRTITLDLSELSSMDADGESTLIRAIRTAAHRASVKVILLDAGRLSLMLSNLEPKVEIYSRAEDALRSLQSQPDYLTSRWMTESAEDKELPLAA